MVRRLMRSSEGLILRTSASGSSTSPVMLMVMPPPGVESWLPCVRVAVLVLLLRWRSGFPPEQLQELQKQMFARQLSPYQAARICVEQRQI